MNNYICSEAENILIKELTSIFGFQINITDDFYEIGGNSIKAIKLSSIMSDLNKELKIKDILTNPIIRDMAIYISDKQFEELEQTTFDETASDSNESDLSLDDMESLFQ